MQISADLLSAFSAPKKAVITFTWVAMQSTELQKGHTIVQRLGSDICLYLITRVTGSAGRLGRRVQSKNLFNDGIGVV